MLRYLNDLSLWIATLRCILGLIPTSYVKNVILLMQSTASLSARTMWQWNYKYFIRSQQNWNHFDRFLSALSQYLSSVPVYNQPYYTIVLLQILLFFLIFFLFFWFIVYFWTFLIIDSACFFFMILIIFSAFINHQYFDLPSFCWWGKYF